MKFQKIRTGSIGAADFLSIHRANVWRGGALVLRDLSLTLRLGESAAILGPNGAGKTTLLKLLCGELRAEARLGTTCRLFDEELWRLEDLRHRIGMVMPDEIRRIPEWEIAGDVVLSSLRGAYARTPRLRFRAAELARSRECQERLGIARLSRRDFHTLSSGEQRRFLIARALVHAPRVLVLDEPFTALDFAASLSLAHLLRRLIREGLTVVLVTHHPGEIPPEAPRAILLHQGRVFADGPKRQVLTKEHLSEIYQTPIRVAWQHGWCSVRAASDRHNPTA